MPVPPKEGESKEEFVSRCIGIETSHNDSKPSGERRDPSQIAAMCYSMWEKRHLEKAVTLQSHITQKALGNAMVITGCLLRPGIWTGLDGVPTKYTEDFINSVDKTLIGTPIKFAHDISPESMDEKIEQGETVGFWTASKNNGSLLARGYVFHPRAIRYLKAHPNVGLSMEAVVATKKAEGHEEALSGKLTGGVLIDDPACPTCRVDSIRETNLERGKKLENTNLIEFKADAKPGREDFFAWLQTQMKTAGIADAIIPKVMGVLQKAIVSPYPYPMPKAQEGDAENKELSDYTDYMKTCTTGGKSVAECAAEWKSKNPGNGGAAPAGADMNMQSGELASLKGELTATKKVIEGMQLEKQNQLVAEIKELDKDFDPVKLLEGVECKSLQNKFLQSYRDTLRQHVKPIKLQISNTDAKAKVKKLQNEMFGTDEELAALVSSKPEEEES